VPVKSAVVAAGLADDRSALLELTKEPTVQRQVAKVAEIQARRDEPRNTELSTRESSTVAISPSDPRTEAISSQDDAMFTKVMIEWIHAEKLRKVLTEVTLAVRRRFIVEALEKPLIFRK
jgi:hypothetical protein